MASFPTLSQCSTPDLGKSSIDSIPADYDFLQSTERNYGIDCECEGDIVKCHEKCPALIGKYVKQRELIDYTYHKHYLPERQLLQDDLIAHFLDTAVHDEINNLTCDRPLEPWLVFTAGPMGAGKGRTMQWLAQKGLFPLSAFVRVDPDALRELLPENIEYIKRNPKTAGYLTQKEVGCISEILTMDALREGKNVLVDGSLRNAAWYLQYIKSLRLQFPKLKIAIMHVTASRETVFARAAKRAEVTGRHVPEDVIIETMEQIPESLRALAPQVHFMATFLNEDGDEPILLWSSRQRLGQNIPGFDKLALFDDSAACEDENGEGSGSSGEGEDQHRLWYTHNTNGEGGVISPHSQRARALSTGKFTSPGVTKFTFDPTDEWKEAFTNTWKMTCALVPVPMSTSKAKTASER